MTIRRAVAIAALCLATTWIVTGAHAQNRWARMPSGTAVDLVQIQFIRPDRGWILGVNGVLLRYDGTAWAAIATPADTVTDIYSRMSVVGPDELWIRTVPNKLLHYRGGHWTPVAFEPRIEISAIDFSSPTHGYAVGSFGLILHYDGASWHSITSHEVPSDVQDPLREVIVRAADDVWMAGDRYAVHYNGHDWQVERFQHKIAVRELGDRLILLGPPHKERRGTSWTQIDKPWLHGVRPVLVRTATAQGSSLWTLLQVNPQRDMRVERIEQESGAAMVGWTLRARAIRDITVESDRAWAIGDGGRIWHTTVQPLPGFIDGTADADVGLSSHGHGFVMADLDRDGQRDFLVGDSGRRWHFLLAQSPGRYRDHPVPASFSEPDVRSKYVRAADLDGNGTDDLLLEVDNAIHILYQFAGGHYATSVRSVTRPEDEPHPPLTEIADLDGDGDLDVYVVQQQDRRGGRRANRIWQNNGFGRMTDILLGTTDGGGGDSWTTMAILADFNGDGRVDIFSANSWSMGHRIHQQHAPGHFSEVEHTGMIGYPYVAGALAADFDNDSDLDILVLSSCVNGTMSRLYRNEGDFRFRDITTAASLSLCIEGKSAPSAHDIDNDSDVDLVIGSAAPAGDHDTSADHMRILLNRRGDCPSGPRHAICFVDVSRKLGLGGIQAQGLLADDIDGDGDIDIYAIARHGQQNRLLVNQHGRDNGLLVALETAPPNRQAIGARITVTSSDGEIIGYRETTWRHPVAHFGLGEHATVDVEVQFPGQHGRVVTRARLSPGRVTIRDRSSIRLLYARAVFWLRHRLAWADTTRELLGAASALLVLVLALLVARRLGASTIIRRPGFIMAFVAVYTALALVYMLHASMSLIGRYLPLVTCTGLAILTLVLDRQLTRRLQARFIGSYEILHTLGEGGMGTVYKARETALGRSRRARARSVKSRIVAVKVLHSRHMPDPGQRKRFAREAELLAQLDHPGIVRILASGECERRDQATVQRAVYIVMEYIDGISLRALMNQRGRTPLDINSVMRIVRRIADALEQVHSMGILHRDIKPDNILVTPTGCATLIDFGIADAPHVSTQTTVGELPGTIAYMSPEQARSTKLDGRTDIYSLGVVTYELLTGQLPYDGAGHVDLLRRILHTDELTDELPDVRRLRPEVTAPLAELVARMLARERAGRPESAGLLVRELDAMLDANGGEWPPLAADTVARAGRDISASEAITVDTAH